MLKLKLLAAAALLGCQMMAASAGTLGLLDLFLKAKTEDPDFISAQANYQAGLKNRDIGLSGLLPNISASASSQETHFGQDTSTTRWTNYDFTAKVRTIQLSQALFDWEKFSGYNEGTARAEYAAAGFAEAKADLVIRLAQAYFDYLLAFDNVDLAQAQKVALAQQAIQAEKLRASGVGTVTDMEETRARHEIAEAQLLSALSTLDLRRRSLEKMVGPMGGDVRRIAGRFEMALPEPSTLATWLDAAGKQNLKLITQQLALRVAEIQVERTQAGHFPSLSLVGSVQKSTNPNYIALADDTRRIGLQLSIPIYEGGKVTAATEQAVFIKEKARSDVESALRDGQIKASQGFLGVVNGIAQVKALEQAVKSSEIALQGMEVGQRAGFRTNTDVLNAQQQLFASKRDLQQQRYLYLLSRLLLKAAVGTLDDEDVAVIDQLLKKATGV